MRKATFIAIVLLASCSSDPDFDSNATANANINFKVWGNCDMCKETIENSLKVDGVTSANWSTETKMMEVNFESTKITFDQVQQNISRAGYDTEKFKGDDKAYDGLHKCCKYKRKE